MLVSVIILILALFLLFFSGAKSEGWNKDSSTPFECGFSPYFFSRFSFSIHYFIVGLIFLFLDLEMCFLFPFLNQDSPSSGLIGHMLIFIVVLLAGLIAEWAAGKMEWKF